MIGNIANADGNTLIKDQNTPGGYTLEGHSTNTTSLAKISGNTWDYVVLQDQSQIPSFPWAQVTVEVLPFAAILCDSIRAANECAIPLFFDTWGREVGDPQWDSIDTFTEMNQRLYNTYEYMANANSGMLSPVGIAFEHIANDLTAVVPFGDLYVGDGSHPSVHGTYLASCIFYELIFETTAIGNTYLPAGVSSVQSAYLQDVAHHVLTNVDSIEISFIDPVADFSFVLNGNEVTFTNESEHDFSWNWDFGDGNTSTDENPIHSYDANGTFTVTLTAEYCGRTDSQTYSVSVNSAGLNTNAQPTLRVYPNPSSDGYITLSLTESENEVTIFSADGKLIEHITMAENTSLEINLPAGLYILKTKTSSIKLLVHS